MKIVRLGAFAIVLLVLGAASFYWVRPVVGYAVYRCLSSAEDRFACIQGKPTAFKTTMFGMVFEGNTRDLLDRHVLGFGAYEKPELFFLRDVSRGGTFVDVGANKGVHSLFMSKYSREIHAFEPYEPVLKKFRRAVQVNGIKNIVIHHVGLGDKAEQLVFEAPDEKNEGEGSFAFISSAGKHEILQIVRGDDALESAGVKDVDLIKIDVEGFERPVLAGLWRVLNRSRPIVVFEISIRQSNSALFKNMAQIAAVFPPTYKFLEFGDRNLFSGAYTIDPILSDSINFSSELEQHNVIAAPAEKSIPPRGPIK